MKWVEFHSEEFLSNASAIILLDIANSSKPAAMILAMIIGSISRSSCLEGRHTSLYHSCAVFEACSICVFASIIFSSGFDLLLPPRVVPGSSEILGLVVVVKGLDRLSLVLAYLEADTVVDMETDGKAGGLDSDKGIGEYGSGGCLHKVLKESRSVEFDRFISSGS